MTIAATTATNEPSQQTLASLSVYHIFRILSDELTLSMFLCGVESFKDSLSRKKYYMRLSFLIKGGLIAKNKNKNKRHSGSSGRYEYTALGTVVRESLDLLAKALTPKIYTQLRAYDVLRRDSNIPELTLLYGLVDDQLLRDIIKKRIIYDDDDDTNAYPNL